MDLQTALTWAAERSDGILITIRADGRPQSSDITYHLDPAAAGCDISVTDGRAKTINMRRDNRVVMHVTDRDSWSYVAFDGTVTLSDVAAEPDDSVCDALVSYYEAVAGKAHPDWDEYRAAMVSEQRLMVRFTPTGAVGQIR